jgi:hypothetical protein
MQKLAACLLASALGAACWILNVGAQVQVPGGQANPARAIPREAGGVHGVCVPTIQKVRNRTGETQIHWSIRSTINLTTLSYTIELPAGATLIQGSLTGSADPGAGATTRGVLTIDLGTGSGFRECALITTASFLANGPTGPMPETAMDEAAVFWGVPSPPLPIVNTPLPGGASQNVAVVPSTTG